MAHGLYRDYVGRCGQFIGVRGGVTGGLYQDTGFAVQQQCWLLGLSFSHALVTSSSECCFTRGPVRGVNLTADTKTPA